MSLSEQDENDIWKRLRKGEAKGVRMEEKINALENSHGEIRDDLKGIRRMLLTGIILFICSVVGTIAAKYF